MRAPFIFQLAFILIFLSASLTSNALFAQSTPGGIKTTNDNVLWLQADKGVTETAGAVSAWADQSGNGNNATQVTVANQPIWQTGIFGTKPAISFDPTTDPQFLSITDNDNLDNTNGLAIFIVMKATDGTGYKGILSKRKLDGTEQAYVLFQNDTKVSSRISGNSNTINSFSDIYTGVDDEFIFTTILNSNTTYQYLNGDFEVSGGNSTVIRSENNDLIIGDFAIGDNRAFDGYIAEVCIFRTTLNNAERLVIENYLSQKYDITVTNDYFSPSTTHTNDIIGIGQSGSDQLTSNAAEGLILGLYDASLDTDGEFLMAGHTGVSSHAVTATAAVSDSLGAGVTKRLARTWYIEKTGTLNASIGFDLSELGGKFPQEKSGYVLLKYNGSGLYEEVAIADADKLISGNTINFNVSDADLTSSIYTLGTTDETNSPLLGDDAKTWYSYKSGNWDEAATWTLDGATTPLWVNPGNETPLAVDNVVITVGKTVTIPDTGSDEIKIAGFDIEGILDLGASSGHDFTTISGSGRIKMKGSGGTDNFPSGDATQFADATDGGILEVYGTGITLDDARTVNHLQVIMDNGTDIATLLADFTINGDLTIQTGDLRINDNSNTALNLSVYGDIWVQGTGTFDGHMSVGTGDVSASDGHELNCYGDFNNSGEIKFTQRSALDVANEATDGHVNVNFLSDNKDQSVQLTGISNFYRIEIDKGTDMTYEVHLAADNTNNFKLYGHANESHASVEQLTDNKNALGLIRGTVRIGNNIVIEKLGNGGNYNISEAARLEVDGGSVTKDEGNAIVLYGEIRVTKGDFTADVTSGITTRENGLIQIDDGTLTVRQIRTSVEGSQHIGGYIQNGGTTTVTGGTVNTNYYLFSLTFTDNVFKMSGGTLHIKGASDSDQGSVFIASSIGNQAITGGTVIVEVTGNNPHTITSTAPFYDLTLRTTSGTGNIEVKGGASGVSGAETTLTAQPLKVLRDLTLETMATMRTSGANTYATYLALCVSGIAADLEVGRNLTIEDGAVLDLWSGAADNSGSSSVTFSGTEDAVLYVGNITSYTKGLVGYTDPESISANNPFQQWELPFYHLTIDKPGATLSLASKNPNDDAGNTSSYVNNGGKNVWGWVSNLVKVIGDFTLTSNSTLDQIDPYATATVGYSLRLYGNNITNEGTFFTFEEGVTPKHGLIKIRKDGGDRTVTTSDGAIFGNLRLNSGEDIITITSDVYIKRLEYKHGRLNVGTYNLKIDVFDVSFNSNDVQKVDNQLTFTEEDMFILAGNASDGGISFKVPRNVDLNYNEYQTDCDEYNDSRWLWYPVGTHANGTERYTPAICYLHNNGTTNGDEYITVRIVDSELQTTDLSGGDILSYYWNVSFEGYATGQEPKVSWLFQYKGDDVTGDEAKYVPGKVLDGGTYQRSTDGDKTAVKHGGAGVLLSNDPRNVIIFNGMDEPDPDDIDAISERLFTSTPEVHSAWANAWPGTGFTLEAANYTAGEATRFVGTPELFYSRVTSGSWYDTDWIDGDNWSLTAHDGSAAGDYPQAGDIAIIGSSTHSGGNSPSHSMNIRDGETVNVAEIQYDISGNIQTRVVVWDNASLTFGRMTVNGNGTATFMQRIDPTDTPTISGDFGEYYASSDALYDIYMKSDGTYNFTPPTNTFPNLFLESGNDPDRIMIFEEDITTLFNFSTYIGANLRTSSDPNNGDITVNGNLNIRGDFVFDDAADRVVTVLGNINLTSSTVSSQRLMVSNDVPSSRRHRIILGGNISQAQASASIDLYGGDIGSNDHDPTYNHVILELNNPGTNTYSYTDGTLPEFYQIILNKGSDQTSTFSFDNDFNLPLPSDISAQPIEIVNGLLILDDSDINITLADASTGNFNIPNIFNDDASSGSGGLEVTAGKVVIEGDDTGIYLDGLLRVNGTNGIIDLGKACDGGTGNGNNYIEYSASGSAKIEVSDGQLIVGSQIRRGISSASGVLDYTQTGGSVVIGQCAATEANRGMLEILNSGSNFTLTGGSLTIKRQNTTNPQVAALWLEPESQDISGSTITLFEDDDVPENEKNAFGINSNISLNNLTIVEDSDCSPSAELFVRGLDVDGTLTINSGTTLIADALNLTLSSDFVNNGTYTGNNNTTFFDASASQNFSGSGVSSLYNVTKDGSGTLSLSMDITITNDLELKNGILSDGGYKINTEGDVTIHATHQSPIAGSGGLYLNGTSKQSLIGKNGSNSQLGRLHIRNSSGVEVPDGLGYEFTINNSLTLEEGIFNIGGNLLSIASGADIMDELGSSTVTSFGSENMIQTNSSFTDNGVKKIFDGTETSFTFPVGQSKYTPVTFSFSSSPTSNGEITVRPANEIHPGITDDSEGSDPDIVDADNVLQYHWILRSDGISGLNGTANFYYSNDDVKFTTPYYTEANYIPAYLKESDNTWDKAYSSNNVIDADDYFWIPITNKGSADIAGDYTAGASVNGSDVPVEAAIPDEVAEYKTKQSGDYTVAANWDPAPSGGGGPSGAIITVTNGHTLRLNADGVRLIRTKIEAGGTLIVDATSNHRLGIVTGSGTLKLVSNSNSVEIPAGFYTDFIDCGTGSTIEYGGTGNYEVLGGLPSVANLTVSDGGIKYIPNADIIICNDLAIQGGATLNDNNFDKQVQVDGDLSILTNGQLTAGAGSFLLSSSTDQTIYGDNTTNGFSGSNAFWALEINKSSGKIILDGSDTDLEINNNGTLTFSSGLIETGEDNKVIINASTTVTGAGSGAYVNGYLKKDITGINSDFTFPIGNATNYKPISVTGANANGWTAIYRQQNPETFGAIGTRAINTADVNSGINEISGLEFWELTSDDVTNPNGSARVSIGWDATTNVSDPDINKIHFMEFDDGSNEWFSHTASRTGNQTEGTITTDFTVTFSKKFFTLGSKGLILLPVQMLSFTAHPTEDGAMLEWKTIQEYNNSHFLIEHSLDGKNWKVIGTETAKGGYENVNSYSFLDEEATPGKNYYRLKQVDYNGTFDYSKVVVLDINLVNELTMVVFPNPVENKQFNIMVNGLLSEQKVAVILYDLMGNPILSTSLSSNKNGRISKLFTIDQSIPTGIYILGVNDGKNILKQKLMIH